MIKVLFISLVLLSTTSYASIMSYRIDSVGRIIASNSGRYYEADDDAENYWYLDDVNNRISLNGSGGAGTQTLKTSLFDVSDILDVTWTGGNTSWVTVNIPDPSPMPEPSTIILIGLGLAGLNLSSRRKKK